MRKSEALMKEISDILIKPTAWGPMLVQRARVALQQSYQMIKDLDDQIEVYKRAHNHAQIERNLEILERFDAGEKQSELAIKYRLTKQRINRIVLMTRKQLESRDGTAQLKGLPRKRHRGVKKTTRARKQKDRAASSDGWGKDGHSGSNHQVGAWQLIMAKFVSGLP